MDKIICVGKNYLKHANELGDAIPTEPLYFIKPPSVLIKHQGDSAPLQVELPKDRGSIHHEVELVLSLAKNASGWYFDRFTVGLDLTLRDLQNQLKKNGQPWEKAKVFKNSAIVGPWQKMPPMEIFLTTPFSLRIGGQEKQHGQGSDMQWKPYDLIEDLPRWFPLREGDLLFTGTPEGVGPLLVGDKLQVKCGAIDYHVVIA